MPAARRLGAISYLVADYDEAIAWFTDVLGFTLIEDTPLGGAIGIHGIGEENDDRLHVQRWQNWTQGCIALTNREIRELRRFVDVGTRVVILK